MADKEKSFDDHMTPEGYIVLDKILREARAEADSFEHGFNCGAAYARNLGTAYAKEAARNAYAAAELELSIRRIRCLTERNNKLGLICFIQGVAMAAGLVCWIYQELSR